MNIEEKRLRLELALGSPTNDAQALIILYQIQHGENPSNEIEKNKDLDVPKALREFALLLNRNPKHWPTPLAIMCVLHFAAKAINQNDAKRLDFIELNMAQVQSSANYNFRVHDAGILRMFNATGNSIREAIDKAMEEKAKGKEIVVEDGAEIHWCNGCSTEVVSEQGKLCDKCRKA